MLMTNVCVCVCACVCVCVCVYVFICHPGKRTLARFPYLPSQSASESCSEILTSSPLLSSSLPCFPSLPPSLHPFRMNSIPSSRLSSRTCGRSPTPGSTCRPASASTSRSTRSACPRTRSAPSKTNSWARSPRSSRSGRRGCWPNCARTSGRSSAKTSCSPSRGRSRRAACCPTLTRRARSDASTACGKPTRSGAWTWWWWSCSRGARWRAPTERDWSSPRSAPTTPCACSRTTWECLSRSWTCTWPTSSTCQVSGLHSFSLPYGYWYLNVII